MEIQWYISMRNVIEMNLQSSQAGEGGEIWR